MAVYLGLMTSLRLMYSQRQQQQPAHDLEQLVAGGVHDPVSRKWRVGGLSVSPPRVECLRTDDLLTSGAEPECRRPAPAEFNSIGRHSHHTQTPLPPPPPPRTQSSPLSDHLYTRLPEKQQAAAELPINRIKSYNTKTYCAKLVWVSCTGGNTPRLSKTLQPLIIMTARLRKYFASVIFAIASHHRILNYLEVS